MTNDDPRDDKYIKSLDAVTVCVNYADYLQHIIQNRKCFDRWMIVTVEDDRETIDLCQSEGLEYCFSDRILTDGGFHKGKGINDGILELQPKDWVCLVDADTYLLEIGFNQLKDQLDFNHDCIFGIRGRYQIDSVAALNSLLDSDKIISSTELDHVGMLIGYFQMWHSSMRQFYPEQWHHAGGDDIIMRDSYHEDNWRFFEMFAIHLGPMFKNHKGRKTERFA